MSLTHAEWSGIMRAQGGHFTADQDRQILADYQRLEARVNTPTEAHAEPGLREALEDAMQLLRIIRTWKALPDDQWRMSYDYLVSEDEATCKKCLRIARPHAKEERDDRLLEHP